MTSIGTATRACAATVIATSVLLSGCVSTVSGTAVRAQHAAPSDVAPLTEAKLDVVLLSVGELNGIMDSTQMEVTSELREMTDHSGEVSDPDCLGAIYGAEDPVYSGSGWTAMRDQVVREPGENDEHWVEQTAVLYPSAEKAQMFFDNLSIPADAKNVKEAYELINFLYRPDIAARNSNFLSYANGNLASQKLLDPKILADKNIYPDEAAIAKLFVITARDPATQRIINRLWTKVKTGR